MTLPIKLDLAKRLKDAALLKRTERERENLCSEAGHALDQIIEAATQFGRCCDLWQDSSGGFHCDECAQRTFRMLRDVQEVLGYGKDGKSLEADRHKAAHERAVQRRAMINFFHGSTIKTENIPEGGFVEMVDFIQRVYNLAKPSASKVGDEARALLTKLGIEP